MASKESFLVLVHYRRSIKKKIRYGIKFTDKDPLSIFLKPTTSFAHFLNSIKQKLGLQGVKQVEKTPELLAKLVDVVSSSCGSNRNIQTPATAVCSSSRPVGASSVPVIAPQEMVVASPSFAVDLNRSGDREVRIIDRAPISLQRIAPDSIDDALPDEDDADDVEPNIIADDSGDDIAASNPAGAGGAFSSETQ
ncbi:hypothetical protein Ahy_B03g064216 [Arachis hypogaea]|uniref:Uncharacterized protein n=1 Tax=Arachis hypogaea TaxID=3818 RepID=A0A444ZZ30_ARAHY|nr:hypothetical protein Ahy_B03g064216 [Arachis hypogaea]